jgi:hypothetical protein
LVDVAGIEPATPCLQSVNWRLVMCGDGLRHTAIR